MNASVSGAKRDDEASPGSAGLQASGKIRLEASDSSNLEFLTLFRPAVSRPSAQCYKGVAKVLAYCARNHASHALHAVAQHNVLSPSAAPFRNHQ